ncbi:MAG: DUF2877 domain-containing protein [Bacillota bacterium]|nr:DUF2877 domain-containing protein [Bacillota bacterium]
MTGSYLRGTSVSAYADNLVSGPRQEGRVLAVFEKTSYMEFPGNRLLCAAVPSVGNGPFTILVELHPRKPLSSLLRPGDRCAVGDGSLEVGGLYADLTGAPRWVSSWQACSGRPEGCVGAVRTRLSAAAELFRREGRRDKPGWLLTFAGDGVPGEMEGESFTGLMLGAARKGLALLRQGVLQGSPALLTAGASSLVGLGPGLTPSGDDLLAGFMLGVQLASRAAGRDAAGSQDVWEPVVMSLGRSTTVVAAAFLRFAARGMVSEPIERLLRALLGWGEVDEASRGVLRLGGSSGNDFMAGLLAGAQAGMAACDGCRSDAERRR